MNTIRIRTKYDKNKFINSFPKSILHNILHKLINNYYLNLSSIRIIFALDGLVTIP